MFNIEGLIRSNNHLETSANECNIKGIIAHLRIVANQIGKLEQKIEDDKSTIEDRKNLHEQQEITTNSINKIRLNCICNKK